MPAWWPRSRRAGSDRARTRRRCDVRVVPGQHRGRGLVGWHLRRPGDAVRAVRDVGLGSMGALGAAGGRAVLLFPGRLVHEGDCARYSLPARVDHADWTHRLIATVAAPNERPGGDGGGYRAVTSCGALSCRRQLLSTSTPCPQIDASGKICWSGHLRRWPFQSGPRPACHSKRISSVWRCSCCAHCFSLAYGPAARSSTTPSLPASLLCCWSDSVG